MTQNTQVTALEHCKTPHKNAPHNDFTHHYVSIYHLDADFNGLLTQTFQVLVPYTGV